MVQSETGKRVDGPLGLSALADELEGEDRFGETVELNLFRQRQRSLLSFISPPGTPLAPPTMASASSSKGGPPISSIVYPSLKFPSPSSLPTRPPPKHPHLPVELIPDFRPEQVSETR